MDLALYDAEDVYKRQIKLWLTLQTMGSDAVASGIEHGFELAEYAEQLLRRYPEIEIVSPCLLYTSIPGLETS